MCVAYTHVGVGRRPYVARACVRAPAAPRLQLEPTDAPLPRRPRPVVEVVDLVEAVGDSGLDEALRQRVRVPRVLDRDRPARAVEGRRGERRAPLPLDAQEGGQHLLAAPPVAAPAVKVLGAAAMVEQRVGRAAAAQHAPAGQVQRPLGRLRLRVRLEAPVPLGVEELNEGHWHRQLERARSRRSGLEQQHACLLVGAQPVGQHAASSAATDDDVIKVVGKHPRRGCPAKGCGTHRRTRQHQGCSDWQCDDDEQHTVQPGARKLASYSYNVNE